MRKIICSLGLLLMIAPAVAAEWLVLWKSNAQALMVDLKSIHREGEYVSLRSRHVQQSPDFIQQDARLLLACQRHEMARTEWVATKRDAKGLTETQILSQNDGSPLVFGSYKENTSDDADGKITTAEAIFSFGCTWQTIKERALTRLPISQ